MTEQERRLLANAIREMRDRIRSLETRVTTLELLVTDDDPDDGEEGTDG